MFSIGLFINFFEVLSKDGANVAFSKNLPIFLFTLATLLDTTFLINLYISDNYSTVLAFPLSSLSKFVKINKSSVVYGWNKEERFKSKNINHIKLN